MGSGSLDALCRERIMALTTLQKRTALFLIGCIGTRSLFAWMAAVSSPAVQQWLAYAALVPAAGFLWIWATGARQTGPEVFGARIWWNALRPVHAALYLSFAAAVLGWQWPHAWVFLAADVVLGLAAFVWHHFG